jgi:hypothetical protein
MVSSCACGDGLGDGFISDRDDDDIIEQGYKTGILDSLVVMNRCNSLGVET